MEKLFYGMGIQALITGFLTSWGLVNPTPGQQVMAAVLLFSTATIVRFFPSQKNKE